MSLSGFALYFNSSFLPFDLFLNLFILPFYSHCFIYFRYTFNLLSTGLHLLEFAYPTEI